MGNVLEFKRKNITKEECKENDIDDMTTNLIDELLENNPQIYDYHWEIVR